MWDETVVLPGSDIGEVAAFARRSGQTWFIGVLNGPAVRTVKVDLGFLGRDRYDGLLVRDTVNDPAAVSVEKTTAHASAPLTIDLRPGGGFVARFTRQ